MSTPPPPKKQALDDPYVFGDEIPAPDAHERNTDTAWALFTELTETHEQRFSPTVPGSVPAELPRAPAPVDAGYAATAPAALQEVPAAPVVMDAQGLEALVQECRINNRVCPRLDSWQGMYDLLPGKRQVNGQWQPPLPISPQAWRVTSSVVKRLCLRDHLEWAAGHGAATLVLAFLKSLPEDKWLHVE